MCICIAFIIAMTGCAVLHAQDMVQPVAQASSLRAGLYGDYARPMYTFTYDSPQSNPYAGYDYRGAGRDGYSYGVGAEVQVLERSSWPVWLSARIGHGTYPGYVEALGDSLPSINQQGQVISQEVHHSLEFVYRQIDIDIVAITYPFGSGFGVSIGPSIGIPIELRSIQRILFPGDMVIEPGPSQPVEYELERPDGRIAIVAARTDHTSGANVRLGLTAGVRYDVSVGHICLSPHASYSLALNTNDMDIYNIRYNVVRAGLDVMVEL